MNWHSAVEQLELLIEHSSHQPRLISGLTHHAANEGVGV